VKPPSKLSSVILWSVISAAFIGPGTITTAVSAGSLFGLDLLWAVAFAIAACIMLQELAARITIASGLNLGQTFVKKFGARHGKWLQWIIGGGVVFGCAAYEAGNILGAVAGLNLATGFNQVFLTCIIFCVVLLVLWFGRPQWISHLMIGLVAIMGISFLALALSIDFTFAEVIAAVINIKIPPQSEMVTLGLVGTTIVPYALFLGSGISKGQTIPLMRVGLTISILIGGFITATILVAGTTVADFSSFPVLASTFENKLGSVGFYALAFGLFAAGFSSAITAPFASGIIAKTVFGISSEKRIRMIWVGVVLTGFIVGVSGLKPIPVILAVQALNGLMLPMLVIFLVVIVNDSTIIPGKAQHPWWYNIFLLTVLFVVLLIGFTQINKTIKAIVMMQLPFYWILIFTMSVVLYVMYLLLKLKRVTK
jgi:Mn2+/Fe2+ NRAMP family transporter